jgi:2,3-diketo-5-methylthio-1-phosphopentane phosphatase
MASPSLPALKTNPKYIFFTDFDGTITQLDSNDYMFEHIGAGPEVRKTAFADVMHGRRTFREMFREQMDQVTLPFDKCIELLLANIKLDEGFKEFFVWARDNNVPIVVVSGGMEPVIRALLAHLLGEEEAESLRIVSSFVGARPGKDINEEGGWELIYRDER